MAAEVPYRTGGDEAYLAQEDSVVGELVRQFADPYAFLRELVQNGLDAGATRLSVRMERLDRGRASWSVEDDGVGMTLATIEGPLLTAFSSSKENAASGDAIGKYGVGFLSVFGLAPTEVRVTSWRAESAHEVRLYPDHTFEVRELPPRAGHGTIVAVEHPVPAGDDARHEARGEAALARWCRHAARPITLERPDGTTRKKIQIDRPLALSAPLVVTREVTGLTVLVGPAAGTDRLAEAVDAREGTGAFAGFYNRGLTLFESSDASQVVQGLRFKVMGPGLKHTLSRDDVRRDREHARALALVRDVADTTLREELAVALRKAAEVASVSGAFGQFDALLAAAWDRCPRKSVVVPLVPTEDGVPHLAHASALREQRQPLLTSRAFSAGARALAARGLSVARLPEDTRAADGLKKDLAAMTGRAVREVEEVMTTFVAADASELGAASDDLAAALGEALEAASGGELEVLFARAEGQPVEGLGVFIAEGEALPHVTVPELYEARRPMGRRRRLLLLADRPAVLQAIRLADEDANLAAAFLARLVLLEHRGALSPDAADALLTHGLGVRG